MTAIGLQDGQQVADARPLTNHVDDYASVLAAKGDAPKHVRQTIMRIRRIIDGCRFVFWADISASEATVFLKGQCEAGAIGAQTFNHYQTSFKSFCQWMVRDHRASENRVAHLRGVNCPSRPAPRTLAP